MSSQDAIPQTLTTMEAGFTLVPGAEDEFWAEQERIGPVVASQPGFSAVIGGPIHNSEWLYFCGKFDSPALMDQWHHLPEHKPLQEGARSTWFGAYYIRKWRRPAEGEDLGDRIWSEVAISRDTPLDDAERAQVVAALDGSLGDLGAMPYETLLGKFEAQRYQFVGPLQEFPQAAPVRYMVLTHWDSRSAYQSWLESSAYATIATLGKAEANGNLPVLHAAGERTALTADGSHREWVRADSG